MSSCEILVPWLPMEPLPLAVSAVLTTAPSGILFSFFSMETILTLQKTCRYSIKTFYYTFIWFINSHFLICFILLLLCVAPQLSLSLFVSIGIFFTNYLKISEVHHVLLSLNTSWCFSPFPYLAQCWLFWRIELFLSVTECSLFWDCLVGL